MDEQQGVEAISFLLAALGHGIGLQSGDAVGHALDVFGRQSGMQLGVPDEHFLRVIPARTEQGLGRRQGRRADQLVGVDVPHVGFPEQQHDGVEYHRHHGGYRGGEYPCGNAHRQCQEDVDRVLGVLERVAEADGRDDGRQRERQSQAVLHEDHGACDGHRQDDHRLHHGLVVAGALLGEHIDPGDREDQQQGGRHRQERDEGPLALRQRLRGRPDDLLQVPAAARGDDAERRHLAHMVEQLRDGRKEPNHEPGAYGEQRVIPDEAQVGRGPHGSAVHDSKCSARAGIG